MQEQAGKETLTYAVSPTLIVLTPGFKYMVFIQLRFSRLNFREPDMKTSM